MGNKKALLVQPQTLSLVDVNDKKGILKAIFSVPITKGNLQEAFKTFEAQQKTISEALHIILDDSFSYVVAKKIDGFSSANKDENLEVIKNTFAGEIPETLDETMWKYSKCQTDEYVQVFALTKRLQQVLQPLLHTDSAGLVHFQSTAMAIQTQIEDEEPYISFYQNKLQHIVFGVQHNCIVFSHALKNDFIESDVEKYLAFFKKKTGNSAKKIYLSGFNPKEKVKAIEFKILETKPELSIFIKEKNKSNNQSFLEVEMSDEKNEVSQSSNSKLFILVALLLGIGIAVFIVVRYGSVIVDNYL